VIVLTADSDVTLKPTDLIVYGEGKTESEAVLKRRARGIATAVEVAGATAQGVVDRQRSITAPWLGLDLPAATTTKPLANLGVKQVKLTRLEEGDRFDFEYKWDAPGGVELPKELGVEVIGARDIRVTAFQKSGMGGSFSISTTKATDVANYDVIIRGRVKANGREEDIYALPLPLQVAERGGQNATAESR
jgi:hypothetical protein